MAFGDIFLVGHSRYSRVGKIARSGSQSQYWILFILPAHGAGHI